MSELNHSTPINRLNATELSHGARFDLHKAQVELSYEELQESKRLVDEAFEGMNVSKIAQEAQRSVELLPHQRIGQIGVNLASVRGEAEQSGRTLQDVQLSRSRSTDGQSNYDLTA